MKVAIGGILHETNVFSPIPCPLSAWRCEEGGEILKKYRGTKSDAGGLIEIAVREGWELVPCLFARMYSSAPADAETYAALKEKLLAPMRAARPDAVLLCLHGAMMAEGLFDAEDDLLAAVRETVGNVPVMISLDLHANNSPRLAELADAVFGYQTNPHVDHYERAVDAAECLARSLKTGVRPVVSIAHAPMMPPTINMRSAVGPMKELLGLCREAEKEPGVLGVSVFGGYPYCDEPNAGVNVAATTLPEAKERGEAICRRICVRAWEIREQFLKPLTNVEEAVSRAKALLEQDDSRPVILADVADNPNGGGPGDTTELLRAMVADDLPGTAAAIITDPETVRAAVKIGVGGTGTFRIGGKAAPGYGAPVEVTGTVKCLSDGRFVGHGPYIRGGELNAGLSARIRAGNVDILVCSVRIACNDADVFRNLGVEPSESRLLLVKSRGHFRASFEPLAGAIIEVSAPGAVNPDLSRYTYRHAYKWPLA